MARASGEPRSELGGDAGVLGEAGKGQLARRLVEIIAERYRSSRAIKKPSSRAG